MSEVGDLHKEWNEDPECRKAYEQLGAEFGLMGALVEARTGAGLTQSELAEHRKRINPIWRWLNRRPTQHFVSVLQASGSDNRFLPFPRAPQ